MKKILVPVTLSGESHAALGVAAYFAQACSATVVVLHVIHRGLVEEGGGASAAWALPFEPEKPPAANSRSPACQQPTSNIQHPTTGDWEVDAADGVEAQLDAIAARIRPRVPVEIIVRSGSPAGTILRQAKEMAADAIVMCTHGYRGWRKWLHRNTAGEVVKRAPCAVWQLSPGKSGEALTLTFANCHSLNWLREPASPFRSMFQVLFPSLPGAEAGRRDMEFHFIVKPSQLA